MTRLDLAPGLAITVDDALTPTQSTTDELVVVSIDVPAGTSYHVSIEAPLGAGVGLWHPDMRHQRTLPPDWAGRYVTSLVRSAPVLALYDADATAAWGVACSHLVGELEVQSGVSEERKMILIELTSRPLDEATTVQLAIATQPAPLPATVGRLAAWVADVNQITPLALPEEATEPVFSTWYTYTQDVDDANVRLEAELAGQLGCGTMFIDDGWQVGGHGRGYGGTGDWTADLDKFPDLAGTIAAVKASGLDTVLWIAPLLLGEHSKAFADMQQYGPDELGTGHHARVLDPRHREVRQFVVDTCRRLVREFGATGLKIDFLNNAMTYQGTPSAGDVADVGEAMRLLLSEIRQGLSDEGLQGAVVEFRQPYVSPAITAYGNCLRVGDCPADAWMNRAASIDLRLFVPSTPHSGAAVHADPLMWAPEGGAAAVAQQFTATFFSVPQVSMPLATLDEVQWAAVAHHLTLWRAWRQPALFGQLQVTGVEMGYTTASATLDGRAVVALFRPEAVDLDALDASEALVLNASPSPTVLLRGQGWTVVESHGPDGGVVAVADPDDGLSEITVPAFGSVVLRKG